MGDLLRTDPPPLTEADVEGLLDLPEDGLNEAQEALDEETALGRVDLVQTTSEQYHYDPYSDAFTIVRQSDANPVLDMNAALRHEAEIGNKGYSPTRELRRVANIPDGVYYLWLKMGVDVLDTDHWPVVARMLDDPDYAFLRTAPGRVSRRARRWYPTEGFARR